MGRARQRAVPRQAYRGGAETVRQRARKRLKRAGPKAEDAESNGARGPFRQRPRALAPPAWARLERRVTDSPTIEAADHLREDRTDLVDHDDTTPGAQGVLRAWCTRVRPRGLAACVSGVGTIDRWIAEITNACQGRQTSGWVEGFNHRVKGLKRRCDGICTVGKRFPRLTLDVPGDQRFGHT
jgi:transposase